MAKKKVKAPILVSELSKAAPTTAKKTKVETKAGATNAYQFVTGKKSSTEKSKVNVLRAAKRFVKGAKDALGTVRSQGLVRSAVTFLTVLRGLSLRGLKTW